MVTKGVASVRSPVQNLQHFKRDIGHEDFVSAVIGSFRYEYGIDEEVGSTQIFRTYFWHILKVQYVNTDESNGISAIEKGQDELKASFVFHHIIQAP